MGERATVRKIFNAGQIRLSLRENRGTDIIAVRYGKVDGRTG